MLSFKKRMKKNTADLEDFQTKKITSADKKGKRIWQRSTWEKLKIKIT